MKKIVLIGLVSNHHTLYISLIKMLLQKKKKVTFLTLSSIGDIIYSFINKDDINIINDIGREDKILIRNLSLINTHDILIMDEYYSLYFRLFNFKIKCKKKILIIHEVNKWMQTKIRYDMKYLFDQYFKSLLLNQFDAFITMGPNIKQYIQFNYNKRPVFFFPFDQSFKNTEIDGGKKNTIKIVLPGMISEDRRNYKDLLKVLDEYYSDFPDSKIRIKFLGRIVSENEKFVTDKSNKINQKYDQRIKYWEEFIPTEEFEKEINNADIILSNVRVFCNFKDRIEIYGITKESGVSFIIYKYAKVAIVPRTQNILSGFDSQLIKFDNYSELYQIFQNIEKNRIEIEQLKKNAIVNKKKFNIKIKKENERLLKYLTEVTT